ncbi:glycerol kinase [Teleopsis dalmanni]|uniref:glycerol kinase n=1 Tax=Teleopsis dalmanni TaxID=139649 RepID=UPI000D32A794|nr:glycerol kinase [Teleopsis dalmanni]XP_037933771.1 glycerol kinase [Teleopsis dalmanni]XP_037933772.1 glycerol kinase [Teleopsis dalmanni]
MSNMVEFEEVSFPPQESTASPVKKSLVGVIDEGTNTVSFCVYSIPDLKEIVTASMDLQMITPQEGWFEQDPNAIITVVHKACASGCAQLSKLGYSIKDIATIGITNQRETIVAWDSLTGKPLYNALVWNDIRTSSLVDRVLNKLPNRNKSHFMDIAGLPVSTYFSALKIMWLMENVSAVKEAIKQKRCKFGTIDSWIVWNLTKGALHITDVTNASRTLLMNIDTLNWDETLLNTFNVCSETLPEIRSSSEIYGEISDERSILKGILISGLIGNQQASLVGQLCLVPGRVKSTYRSGCFLLYNTGEKKVVSSTGLLTTVAYKLGKDAPVHYALEGAVAVGGRALEWLQTKVRIMHVGADSENFASAVPTTGDVYFVPAFTGLYAPYWRKDARGIICGLTQFTTKHHIIRAALESICFQTRDVLEYMQAEVRIDLQKLQVDGSLASNNLLMQLQADTTGLTVYRSQLQDTTAFGAALCAGQAKGIELCSLENSTFDVMEFDKFSPIGDNKERKLRYDKWKKAVKRSLGWTKSEPKKESKINKNVALENLVPATVFILGAVVAILFVKSKYC